VVAQRLAVAELDDPSVLDGDDRFEISLLVEVE